MSVPLEELERRMRPGSWSYAGFLGPNERLEEVISTDASTLVELGVSCDQLSVALSVLTDVGSVRWLEEVLDIGAEGSDDPELSALIAEQMGGITSKLTTVRAWHDRIGDYDGVLAAFDARTQITCGTQPCPFGPAGRFNGLGNDVEPCATSGSDWWIRNRRTGQEMRGPVLIVHLIEAHGFFEGPESPYRVDPHALASLLELRPGQER